MALCSCLSCISVYSGTLNSILVITLKVQAPREIAILFNFKIFSTMYCTCRLLLQHCSFDMHTNAVGPMDKKNLLYYHIKRSIGI